MPTHPSPTKKLTALAWFVYFASYLTRQNYAAVLAPMLAEFGIGKARLSLASTAGFVAYGAGQLLCALLLRRVSAQRLLFGGLLTTAGCNVLLAGITTVYAHGAGFTAASLPWCMAGVWGLNGFAQAMLWPSLVLLMARAFTPEDYKRATVSVTVASSFGTVAVYLLVPLCVRLGSWRAIFLLCAAVTVVAALVWQRGTGEGLELDEPTENVLRSRRGNAAPYKGSADGAAPFILPNRHWRNPCRARHCPAVNAKQNNLSSANNAEPSPLTLPHLLFRMGLLPLLLAVALQGMLRDGVTTWMPVLVSEAYPGFTASKSVLTAAVLPLFAALSIRLAGRIERKLGSEFRGAVLFFALGTACATALPFALGMLPLSVALMALLTGCMHGVNLMLVCQLPARFERFGATGLAAGLINCFTYIGSSVSMFGIALLAERFGWRPTAAVWAAIALGGTLICLFCTGKARRNLQLAKL